MERSSIRDRGISAARRIASPRVHAMVRRRSKLQETEPELPTQIAELTKRVNELESEVQENRQLNMRLAELITVVQELLLPIAQRDDKRLNELLARYAEKL